jgi:ApbE superfamily uncharacterized protein (UPF0280 family)
MYQPRSYRLWVRDKDLTSFSVAVKETDLYVRASSNLKSTTYELVQKYRSMLEDYIEQHPRFATSLKPMSVARKVPDIIREMAAATKKVGVGPMASVAGAIAQFVSQELLGYSPEVIIENGGDIYMKSLKDRTVGIYAGRSPLSGKLGLEIRADETPLGVCTSSGTVGHSLSFGKADAVVVTSSSAILADAAATAIGNIISSPDDFPKGIEFAQNIEGLLGVVIIKDDKMSVWGKITLRSIA